MSLAGECPNPNCFDIKPHIHVAAFDRETGNYTTETIYPGEQDWHHPGPDLIEPNTCPGGVVIRIYSVPDEVLLMEQRIYPGGDVTQAALGAAEGTAGTPAVCLVGYDGDSGERFATTAWLGEEDDA